MAYQRKTIDFYELHGDFGYGLEFICAASNWKEAKADKKAYLENDRNVSNLIIKKKREKEKMREKREERKKERKQVYFLSIICITNL